MVQVPNAATVVQPELANVNGALVAKLLMTKFEPPVLVKVIIGQATGVPTAELPHAEVAEENETAGGVTPVQVKAIDCGLFAALLVKTNESLFAPAVVGLQATPRSSYSLPPDSMGRYLIRLE